MKIPTLFLALSAAALLAGCSQPDPEAPGSDQPIENAPVDADPTPQTGTGGKSQTTSPDATVNQ